MIYWFTGQPGSGKTTIAHAWATQISAHVIDGDELRRLFPEGYDEAGRRRNVMRAQAIAGYLAHHVGHVCVALIAPYRDQRDAFNKRFPVCEVYVHSLRREREAYFVKEYEPPVQPILELNTSEMSIDDCLEALRGVHW